VSEDPMVKSTHIVKSNQEHSFYKRNHRAKEEAGLGMNMTRFKLLSKLPQSISKNVNKYI
jgi:hypothetical protein